MKRIPTVQVDRGGVPVTINKHDYSPAADTLWGEKKPTKKKTAKKKAAKKQAKK